MRWWIALIVAGFMSANATPVLSQTFVQPSQASYKTPSNEATPIVDRVEFLGLRHISPAAVKRQLSLLPGDRFDAAKLEHDIRTLARLGWFSAIRVDETPPEVTSESKPSRVSLIFHLEEEPILSRVEYSGSRLLSTNQIEKLLEEKKLPLGLGKPADSVALHRIALAIRLALNEFAHPYASVKVLRQIHENGTVSVRFEIADGPHLPVRQVGFEGDTGVSEKLLLAQMLYIAPGKPLASLRGKEAYTREAFEEDRRRILTYYQDHGYPEARVGNAHLERIAEPSRKWFPLPHQVAKAGLDLFIPVHAGPFYRLAAVEVRPALEQALGERHGERLSSPVPGQDHAFSQQEVDNLRRFCSAHLQFRDSKSNTSFFQAVDANPIFDPVEHSVRLKLSVGDSPPYLVRRIEFLGLHKFNDRFVRRRIHLREGYPLDERALELGLTKLARTGYFKPIRKENTHIQLDEVSHTADVTIRLEEIGQQRVTFDGGRAQFGSTLGLAYTVFDLFTHEELLSAKLDGGPESLQLLLGIAKDGIFGTRSSLAFSIFNNVIRPRFTHGVQGPFTTSRTEGINIPWTYALTNSDSLGVNYTLSRTAADETFAATNTTTGSPMDLRTRTSSRSLGTSWARDTGNERFLFSNSISGGLLGGDENMLRSSGEAARIFRDPFFSPKNSWAFRTTFSTAGSYHGDMPFYSRFFSGDEYVRGLRTGELGPLAMTEHLTPSGTIISSPSYAGSNLITAANAEYRIPFHNGIEAAGFFDLGSGRLLPNWLGPTKPNLLSATNGILHGSTGVQLQWTIPGVQVPFRSYYAVNVLRLDRWIPLSEKSLLHAHNRLGAFGWGLGSLF
ncbi:MAG TPA: POTRA domain-containing protein [Candidatus Acidoferrum sp.]|nr:POTRA domain-containing protein [Candidatus Acidoferrum sp.]